MARLQKAGLDYFSHDTDTDTDNRMRFIQAKHGLIGYAVYFKILERIYKNGYSIEFTERDIIMFANDYRIEIDVCKTLIDDYIIEGLFDRNLYKKYNILTSQSIQNRYFMGTKRRDKVIAYKNTLLVDINSFGDNINVIDDDSSTQSKVKKSKEKKEDYFEGLIPESLRSDEFLDTWKEWIGYRKEIKKPIKETTAKGQLKDLVNLYDPIGVINQSIKNSWTGLFELKTNGKPENKITPVNLKL